MNLKRGSILVNRCDMFKLFFIKRHKNKVITYIDSVIERPAKQTPDIRYSLSLDPEETPKFSREVPSDTEIKYSDRGGADTSSESRIKYSLKPDKKEDYDSDIKYSDRGPATDSFNAQLIADAMRSHLRDSKPATSLMSSANISFVNKLEQYIREKNLVVADVYKAANIDRRLFSKMLCNRDYQPSKDTVLALVFALKLSLSEASDLLERAGYTLSHSIRRDIILEYFIKEKIYNLNNINAFLYNMNEKVIGRNV